ncbi:MAG: LacI family DNA-binding transcriptional regulator [Trueperaceae bacterium]|nr:MAG: LacI family DNA-binding transcriptional regulator [Trueperaceae bacterium]
MPTIREVSRRAKVSISTVSRVVNGTAPVAEKTRHRVLKAIEELDYTPNVLARGLITKRSGGIGVIVNDLTSPFFGSILDGIEAEVEAQGMHMIVASGHADAKRESKAIHFLRQRLPDAMIIQVDGTSDPELLELAAHKIPTIVFGRHITELGERCIYLDNEQGGFLATQHLIDCGHSRIGHIAGPLTIADSRARLQGYRRALEGAGTPYNRGWVIEADYLEAGGYRATRHLLERTCDLSAIFCSNDQMAAGALQALREAGIRVPEDVSIIGYDDIPLARYLYPSLTTIRQPLFEMGRAVAEIAFKALAGKRAEVRHKFEPELIERESVQCPE